VQRVDMNCTIDKARNMVRYLQHMSKYEMDAEQYKCRQWTQYGM